MQQRDDTTFLNEYGRFNFRVGAVIIDNGRILMVRNKKNSEYYSVGGRCKMNETTAAAAERECLEETGIRFRADRLGFIHENFFTSVNERFHEISFYYYMIPLESIDGIGKDKLDLTEDEELEWIPIDKAKDIPNFYPDFFKTALVDSSFDIKHFITKD